MKETPSVGTYLPWREGLWRVVALTPPVAVMQRVDDETDVATCPILDLPEIDSDVALSDVSVIDTLSAEKQKRILFLRRHIHEIVTGLPPDVPEDTEPRPAYGPSTTQAARIQAKADELKPLGQGFSQRTLLRHVLAYRRDGVAGLVDHRGKASEMRVTPEVNALYLEVARKYSLSSTVPTKTVLHDLRRAAAERGLVLPSRATQYRLVAQHSETTGSGRSASERRSRDNQPDRTHQPLVALGLGQVVELDSTPLDALLLAPDGTSFRPTLSIAVDVASRSILGALLSPDDPKDIDLVFLLERMLTRLGERHGWDDGSNWKWLPAGMFADHRDAIHRALREHPVLWPSAFTIDRGLQYQSKTFRAACRTLGISVTNSAPYSPTDKPHVERTFRTIREDFVSHLNGHIGWNPTHRGRKADKEAFWTMEAAQALLDIWVTTTWQDRPHEGLTLPEARGITFSPKQMFAAKSVLNPPPTRRFTREDQIKLWRVQYRTVGPQGVRFESVIYDDPALHPLRRMKSGIKHQNGHWEVRYNPYDITVIYVHDHRNDQWIAARWTGADRLGLPTSQDLMRVAIRNLREARAGTYLPDHLVVDEIARIQRNAKTRTEKKVRRKSQGGTPTSVETPPAVPFENPDSAPPPTSTDPKKVKALPRAKRGL